MEQISASKFKEQCLALLDSLDPEGIEITKHGKPVARLIPASADCADLIRVIRESAANIPPQTIHDR